MSDRLPADCYPRDLGPYPNPALTCANCGTPEGRPHDDPLGQCPAGVVVSLQRRAFEAGYRSGRARGRLLDLTE